MSRFDNDEREVRRRRVLDVFVRLGVPFARIMNDEPVSEYGLFRGYCHTKSGDVGILVENPFDQSLWVYHLTRSGNPAALYEFRSS